MKTLYYIKDIHKAICEFENYFQKNYRLNFNECMALCNLDLHPCTSGELALEMNLSYSNMSKTLKSLQSKKLIKQTILKDDRRKKIFSLTEEGLKRIEIMPSEKDTVPKSLKTLINYFEQHYKQQPK